LRGGGSGGWHRGVRSRGRLSQRVRYDANGHLPTSGECQLRLGVVGSQRAGLVSRWKTK
jgi:hypothetical protein